LSDGELSHDDGGEDLDTSVCKTCNITFTNNKVSTIDLQTDWRLLTCIP